MTFESLLILYWRLPYAALHRRFQVIEFEFLNPRILLISYARILSDIYAVHRDVHPADRRFLTQIIVSELPVLVSKTRRHLRFGGITSGSAIARQEYNVPESQAVHVFNCSIV